MTKQEESGKYICCEALEKALGDHKGLYSQIIGRLDSDEMDEIIMYIGGDFKLRSPIIVQFCPFCGKKRIRYSESDEGKNNVA